MLQAMINFRMDEDLKRGMEEVCKEMGLSITAAFTIFATKVSKEKRIPFKVAVDPFYSEANTECLRNAIADAKSGKNMTAHEIIEDEDDYPMANLKRLRCLLYNIVKFRGGYIS